MGAMNGVDLSNTRWLYQAAGWKGMLIEACPGEACPSEPFLTFPRPHLALPFHLLACWPAAGVGMHARLPAVWPAAHPCTRAAPAGMYGDLQRNRRDAITVHAAACGEFRTVHWHSAGNVGGIYEFMAGACLRCQLGWHMHVVPG